MERDGSRPPGSWAGDVGWLGPCARGCAHANRPGGASLAGLGWPKWAGGSRRAGRNGVVGWVGVAGVASRIGLWGLGPGGFRSG